MLFTKLFPQFRGGCRIRRGASARRPDEPADVRTEELETRIVPYVASGNLWAHPELVTISFAPDGTDLGGGETSDLFADMNAKFGSPAVWQAPILKAAQAWAQQTNLNFSVVADNGSPSGSGDYQQGDPGFGDIRIMGYDFGTSTLAFAFSPPPINNFSIAGDIQFNTGVTWNIGSTFDVFTVSLHEFGHALGLNHSLSSAASMYSSYNGVDAALNTDDINGIRNIYSANAVRSKDSYDTVSNGTFSAASNITSQIDTTLKTALVQNLDITTTSDLDYYKFTAPTGGTGTLVVHVQSSGLSLLQPKAWVYNGSQSQLAVATGTGYEGSTLTLTVNGIVAGNTYYVKVDGAVATANGTGKYALTLNFGTNADPTVPLPDTQTPNGDPISAGGGQAVDVFNPGRITERHNGKSGSETDSETKGRSEDSSTRPKSHAAVSTGSVTADWDAILNALNALSG